MASHRQQQISRVEFWNSIKPDPNYIPGLGRGAQGFTTRSDIGPSKFTPTVSQQQVRHTNTVIYSVSNHGSSKHILVYLHPLLGGFDLHLDIDDKQLS